MADNEASPDERRKAAQALSTWLAREMAAAADQSAGGDLSSESAERAIDQCADLMSRYWPAVADGECASGASHREGDANESALLHAAASNNGNEFVEGRLGRFEVRRPLGHGGFGVVFLVFDPRLNREAALKIPRPEILVSPTLRQRFLREAQSAAVLDHPNILPIYETGEIGPVGYILSAYCNGPTLARWFSEQPGPVSARMTAETVAQLAGAVQHAHSRGILHRDIKPSNVLLEPISESRHGDLPFVPRLTDFGLATRLDEMGDETRRGAVLGTPHYMAPEQAAGNHRDIGVQTDVYSLGVILYELLTGQPPFVGGTDSETLHRIAEHELSPAALRARRVPGDLETIVLKCLEKDQAARYPSAGELADDLQRFLAGEPVSARAIGSGGRLVRWCRRRPVIAALGLGIIASVALGGSAATWQWLRAELNLVNARAEASRAEKNLEQAEDTLLDLAWLVEESTLWDTRNKSVLGAIHAKLDEYHHSVAAQRDTDAAPAPLMAAVYSFAARNAVASGDRSAADENYRRSLELWREIVSRHADHPGYRRAVALCLLNYCRFLLDAKQTPGGADLLEMPRSFLRAIADDDRWRHWSLFDFAQLTLEYGDALDGATRFRDSLDVYQLGLIASEELQRHDPNNPRWNYHIGQYCRLIGVHQERLKAGDAALQTLTRAKDSLQVAADAARQEWLYRRELAMTLRSIGKIHRERKHPAEGMPLVEAAAALYTNLCNEKSDVPALHADLAQTFRLLAAMQVDLDLQEQALTTFSKCRESWQRFASLDGEGSDDSLKLIGHACYDEGELAMILKRHDVARVALAEGAAAFELASQRKRMNASDDEDWAGCHIFLGFQQAAAEELQPAIKSYETAIKILEPRVTRPNPDKRLKDLHRRCIQRVEELKSKQSTALEDA